MFPDNVVVPPLTPTLSTLACIHTPREYKWRRSVFLPLWRSAWVFYCQRPSLTSKMVQELHLLARPTIHFYHPLIVENVHHIDERTVSLPPSDSNTSFLPSLSRRNLPSPVDGEISGHATTWPERVNHHPPWMTTNHNPPVGLWIRAVLPSSSPHGNQ